ncbi:hypothetical protein BO71DRAFT_115474 [Aspergillus ellipticus CBS 707.79]|uniref:Uncharacterized protein n=1 Tax=Aspergillus ellipticus CBS 707.79 TaxID=1448320 RepID=A0A319DJG5_9EURO|nr:hypothetical protein BO71DRAFT_115474 [Aspergillus ellipticus CBS 707.79]
MGYSVLGPQIHLAWLHCLLTEGDYAPDTGWQNRGGKKVTGKGRENGNPSIRLEIPLPFSLPLPPSRFMCETFNIIFPPCSFPFLRFPIHTMGQHSLGIGRWFFIDFPETQVRGRSAPRTMVACPVSVPNLGPAHPYGLLHFPLTKRHEVSNQPTIAAVCYCDCRVRYLPPYFTMIR